MADCTEVCHEVAMENIGRLLGVGKLLILLHETIWQ